MGRVEDRNRYLTSILARQGVYLVEWESDEDLKTQVCFTFSGTLNKISLPEMKNPLSRASHAGPYGPSTSDCSDYQ